MAETRHAESRYPATQAGQLARLREEKPSPEDLATAERVLRWLADHAHFFPLEYYPEASEDLAKAANMCRVNVDDLVLSENE